jgi:hypothetical protein
LREHGTLKLRVNLILAENDLSGREHFVEVRPADFLSVHHAFDDSLVVRWQDLPAG